MREIWTKEEAEFHGEFVDFDPIWSWPKPVQSPLPVYIGGNTEHTLKRVIEFGDGWIPNAGRSRLTAQIPEFRRLCEESGRGHLPLTVYGTRPTPEAIADYEALGVDRLVFWMPSKPRDDVLRELELVTEVVGDRLS
jgi:alkanesulfonate monooxygenase SsuD/methylene tetrahydromethanopterin reductase-like flavin-dependent oxidoreductase (luciferase family)